MDGRTEYLWKYLEHLFKSIELFDQKAAAVIAISVGMVFVVYEVAIKPGNSNGLKKVLGGLCMLFLVSSMMAALHSIHPPAGIADSHVEGGKHMLPHVAVEVSSQSEYLHWVSGAPPEELNAELAALVWSRVEVRDWKVRRLRIAIKLMYLAVALLIGIVLLQLSGHIMTLGLSARVLFRRLSEKPLGPPRMETEEARLTAQQPTTEVKPGPGSGQATLLGGTDMPGDT